MLKLTPRRDLAIYDLLEQQAKVANRAGETFLEMAKDFSNLAKYATALDEIEKEGDRLTHELQNKIATMFMTPLDKEDLRELSQALDDVTDLIEAAAARALLYSLKQARADLQPAIELLLELTKLTESAVKKLRNGFTKSQTLRATLTEIHTVENHSDRQFRASLKNLFDEPGIDPLNVMKWKEMFDRIEQASDKCEDIAAIIGTIIDKYS